MAAFNGKRILVFASGLTSSLVLCHAADRYYLSQRRSSRGSVVLYARQNVRSRLGNEADELKLQQVQVVVRHGARTPFKFIPNIEQATWPVKDNEDLPHTLINHTVRSIEFGGKPESAIDNAYKDKDRLRGGSLVGQLTKVGQEQMYQLGRTYKKRYIDELGFLSPNYNHEELYVRSTNIKRTIISARCFLAGLFSGSNTKGTIPIFTSVNEHEALYPNYYFCKNLKHWAEIAWNSYDDMPGIMKFNDAVTHDLGLDSSRKVSVIGLVDNMFARAAKNAPIPECLLKRRDEIESFAVQHQLRVLVGTGKSPRITRLSVGALIEAICTQLEDRSRNESDLKMVLYSAHDTTLMAVLFALGVYDYKWPKYAADVKIELYKDRAGKSFIKVLYNDKEMRLPGCNSSLCSLRRFLEICEPLRVKDWDAECGVKGDYKKETFAIGTI